VEGPNKCQPRRDVGHYKSQPEEMRTAINVIQCAQAEFEETIIRWVEGILASVNLRMQSLHKELGSELQGTKVLVEAMLHDLKKNWQKSKPKQSMEAVGMQRPTWVGLESPRDHGH
jgi:hypothetical protein